MHAFEIEQFGTRGELRDVALPEPGSGEVRVRIAVAGVNPVDWKIRSGKAGKKPLPLVLGQDFAGVVDRVGPGVTTLKPGERVFGCARKHGAYAEYTVVGANEPGSPIATIPDGIADDTASALPTPALTALASINLIGVRSESTLVVVGATGSLGAAAVQLSVARGAHVVAVVQEKQQDDARAFGAQHVVVSNDGVADAIRDAFADGVDAVLDTAANSQDELAKWADVLKPNGILVSPNHVADEAFFAQRGFRAKNITLTEQPEASADGLRTLAKNVLEGTLRVVVGEHGSLAEAGDFLDRGERHDLHAKAVLAV